jgi:hypothetical protein
MAPRNNDDDHRRLIELLPTVVPGTLYDTIRQAFGFRQGSSVHQMLKRLRAAGYDLTRYDVEASRRDTSERRLESARKASEIARAKALEKVKAKAKTPIKSESPAKTRAPQTVQNQARAKNPDLVPAVVSEAPEHAKKRREGWLREMKAVSGWPNATGLLAAAWQTDLSTVYSRIAVLRQVGYDLSFWTPAPSRPESERIESRSNPRESISTTVFALSEIAGVPYEIADEIADRLGVPSFSGFCPVRGCSISARGLVSPEQASRILSRLGFVRRSRLAQEFPSWEMS